VIWSRKLAWFPRVGQLHIRQQLIACSHQLLLLPPAALPYQQLTEPPRGYNKNPHHNKIDAKHRSSLQ
jgi:hypothetical protein